MKRLYSTLIILLGICLGGFLFAQQSGRIGFRPFLGNIDSLRTESSEEGAGLEKGLSGSIAELDLSGIREQIAEAFRNLGDRLSSAFPEEPAVSERIQKLMESNKFKERLEQLQTEEFSEEFFNRIRGCLEKCHDGEFNLEINKDFAQRLHNKLGHIRDMIGESPREIQDEKNPGEPI